MKKKLALIFTILTCQTLHAGFFRDFVDQTILGKGYSYPSCDTQDLSDKEHTEAEFRQMRAKYVRKGKHCKLAKLTFDLYMQNIDLYNEFGRMLPALEALKNGGHFMDFAWEFRNFEEAYVGSKDRELVHFWRVETYLKAIPTETKYCTRPLGYYLDQRNNRNDIGTEAAIIFKKFEQDWPDSKYLDQKESWWELLANYETNYAVCTSEGHYNQWRRISKRERHPGPLIAAYQDLARSLSRDRQPPIRPDSLLDSENLNCFKRLSK